MDKNTDVSIINHTCRLLFPFYHRFEYLSKADNIEGWQGWRKRLNESESKGAEDSTLYFQPFVRQMLFPEWRCSDEEGIQPHDTRHLTRMMNGQSFSSNFSLQLLSKDGEPDGEPFNGRVLWVDAYLFPDGIGILVLAVQLTTENFTLHRLADFLWAVRMVLPPFLGFVMPRLSLSTALGENLVDSMRELIDQLLAPFVDAEQLGGKPGMSYTQTLVGKEEGERCYTFTYAQWDSDSADGSKISFADLPQRDMWLYELGTVTPVSGINIPEKEYIRRLLSEHRIAVWESWTGLALRDTVTFFERCAGDKKESSSTPLSQNVAWDYFFLYLYCIYQRTALLRLQNNLIEAGVDSDTRRQQLEELLSSFVEFRNRFWFAEVTRKVLGSELYRKFQQGLETPVLYDFVSSEIQDLYTFFCTVSNRERAEQEKRQAEAESERDRKLNKRISFIATLFGLPSLVIGFLGINLKGFTASDGLSLLSALLFAGGSLLLGFALGFGITRQKAYPKPDKASDY